MVCFGICSKEKDQVDMTCYHAPSLMSVLECFVLDEGTPFVLLYTCRSLLLMEEQIKGISLLVLLSLLFSKVETFASIGTNECSLPHWNSPGPLIHLVLDRLVQTFQQFIFLKTVHKLANFITYIQQFCTYNKQVIIQFILIYLRYIN